VGGGEADCPGVADLGDAGGVDARGDVEGDERPDPGERGSGDEESGTTQAMERRRGPGA
jgi:hypothetical protein